MKRLLGTPIHIAVAIAGSQAKLARKIGLTQQQVSRLARGKHKVKAEVAIAIETATSGSVPRWRLRPDIWPAPIDSQEAA